MLLVRGRFCTIKIRYFFVHSWVISLVFRICYSDLVKDIFHVLFFSEVCITHFGSLFPLAKTGVTKLIAKIIDLLTVPHFRCFCVFYLFDFRRILFSRFGNSVDFSEFFILILYKSDCFFVLQIFFPVKVALFYPIKELRPAYCQDSIFELETFVWIHINLFHSGFQRKVLPDSIEASVLKFTIICWFVSEPNFSDNIEQSASENAEEKLETWNFVLIFYGRFLWDAFSFGRLWFSINEKSNSIREVLAIRKPAKVSGSLGPIRYRLYPIEKPFRQFVNHFTEVLIDKILLKPHFEIRMKGLILPKVLHLIGQWIIFNTDKFILTKDSFDKNEIFQIKVELFLINFTVAKIVDYQILTWTVKDHLSQLIKEKYLWNLF
jgi:hypothetical protein